MADQKYDLSDIDDVVHGATDPIVGELIEIKKLLRQILAELKRK